MNNGNENQQELLDFLDDGGYITQISCEAQLMKRYAQRCVPGTFPDGHT